ncbi:MAG: TIR domain-containing protein [Clostridia bacterium]|nr:TIR domain-containing protein [Clostridia bacterium]
MSTSVPTIFISYAHKDSDVVLNIIDAMHKAGFNIWYDKGIEIGSEWPEYIAEKLIGCECFIAFMSKNYLASHNCRREVNLAIKKHKEILVIYLEDVELTPGMEMQLDILQAIFRKNMASDAEFINAICGIKMLQNCRKTGVSAVNPVAAPQYQQPAFFAQTIQSPSAVFVQQLKGIEENQAYTYTGYAFDGRRQGTGRCVYSSGDVYDGEWYNDKRNGQGQYIWANGKTFDGEWVDGNIGRRGRMSWPNGAFYEGEWHNSQFNGRGKMTYANGDVYAGDWNHGQYHGQGIYIYANGKTSKGRWENGKKKLF